MWLNRLKFEEQNIQITKERLFELVELENHAGKPIRFFYVHLYIKPFFCSCKRECFAKISEEERLLILKQFNDMYDKNSQDSHLADLILMKASSERQQ